MLDYSDWNEYEGASEGSGRSDKVWLINEIGTIGLFKFTKTLDTKEHISERLAYEIASIIGLECAEVDIGLYQERNGCMSYLINKDDDVLIEGINLINREYPYYNPSTLYDPIEKEYYSLEMVINSLYDYDLVNDFIKIIIFDFLIGNTDRHHSNWAVLQNNINIKMCPIYDSGSSLCCYISEQDIDSFLGRDTMKFNSLVNTRSRSRIRVNKKIKKEPTHLEVINFIKYRYWNSTIEEYVIGIINNLTSNKVDEILNNYSNEHISIKRKTLLKKYISVKIELLKDVFIGKEDLHVD